MDLRQGLVPLQRGIGAFSHRPKMASVIFVGVVLSMITGCGSSRRSDLVSSEETAPVTDLEKDITAEEILRRTATAYQDCETYSDEGELLVHFPGSETPNKFPFSIAFDRKRKRLFIAAYQVSLASDGKRMRGFIEDALSNNLDGQFLDGPAPSQLTPETVIEDAEAAAILSQGAGGPPPVLEWLLAKSPFAEILSAPKRLKKIASRELAERAYYRVQVDLDESPSSTKASAPDAVSRGENSKIIIWIDQATWLVGRLEYPQIRAPARENSALEQEISIVAEFRNAQINQEMEAKQFTLTPLPDAKTVSFFVPPPPPIPTTRLGKEVATFDLTDLERGKFSSDVLRGKTVILLVVRNHPACEEAAVELERVYQSLKDDPRFAFQIVANESSDVSNANILAMFRRWNVHLPAARDAGPTTGDALGVESLPTLLILDSQGKLQFSQSFGFSSIGSTLPALCEQVASGELIFKRLLDVRKQYEERLALARSGGKPQAIEISPTKVAPARAPRKLSLEPAWNLPDLKSASCLLISTLEKETRLLVLESPNTIHSVSLSGKPLIQKRLKTPNGAAVRVLRSASDSRDRNSYIAFAPGGEAAYFLDQNLDLISSFPPQGQSHEGVSDALISDLDGEKDLEAYVGFSAFLGVQATSLSGERRWRNLAIPSVISLTAGPKNVAGWKKLFATDDRGRIILLNQFGNHEMIELADREIHRLFSRADALAEIGAAGDAIYLGISFQEKDKLLAIGYDSEFNEAWNYQLPPGVFVGPVQYCAPLLIPDTKEAFWVVAAPDGSIHFIGSKGDFEDSACIGERITGLCCTIFQDRPLLIYSTETGIHASYMKLPKK